MRITHFCALAAAFITYPATAGTPDDVVQMVHAAIAKGYGEVCSLEMVPVAASQGYYNCIQIEPYRFVEEYGRTRGFVVIPGQAPFEVFVSDANGSRFQVQGNWVTDMPARVDAWWAETVLGGRAAAITKQTDQDRAAAAGAAVDAYLQSLAPQPEPAPAPQVVAAQPAPQVIYIVPPNYGTPGVPPAATSQQIPVSGVGFPAIGSQQSSLMPAPGGVLVAPGVVAYPAGAP